MNVYTCVFGKNHIGGVMVVTAEDEEDAIKVAEAELVKNGHIGKTIEQIRAIPLDVKQAYILEEFGY